MIFYATFLNIWTIFFFTILTIFDHLDNIFTILDHFYKHFEKKTQKTGCPAKSRTNRQKAGQAGQIAKKQDVLLKAGHLASLNFNSQMSIDR